MIIRGGREVVLVREEFLFRRDIYAVFSWIEVLSFTGYLLYINSTLLDHVHGIAGSC